MSSYQTALHNKTVILRADDNSAEGHVWVERSDNQLVDLALAGEATAFEHLFDRHKKMVALVAARYFRRHDEIEEIIQISFAKAFTELGSFRGQYDRSMAGWLVRIASNACLDSLRSRRRKLERLNCDLSEHEARALFETASNDTRLAEKSAVDHDLVEKLLSALPPDDRALLQMMYAEEMSVTDIAEMFGWSRSNVKIRAWRARSALRKLLRKYL